ncbi:MAG: hypothetical protein ACE141_18385 [Bryobacteraceae bacterium]
MRICSGVRRMGMIINPPAVVRLSCVIGVAVQMEMDEWSVAECRNHGKAQTQGERRLHGNPL